MIVLGTVSLLVVLLMIGVPIVFTFGAATLFIALAGDYNMATLLPAGYNRMNNMVLVAVPLFIYSGALIQKGRIAEPLIGMAEMFFKKIRGSMAIVSVVASAAFGSISGSAAATLSCMGSILLPKMYKDGYPRAIANALVINASPLGLLIPPSADLILFAWIAQQSVLACFLATVIPGLILMTLLIIVSLFLLRNKDIAKDPELDKPLTAELFASRIKTASPALTMPVIVLGGIYAGFVTPTEAAAISVFVAVILGRWVYKGLNTGAFREASVDSAVTSGVFMVMLFVVMIMSRLFVFEDFSQITLDFLYSISDNKWVVLFMVNLLMIIIGMLMDDASGILISTPILIPVVQELGISPIHFAAIQGVNLGMGTITPPTAPLLYLGARVGKTPVPEMLTPTMYYILFAWIPTLILTTVFPAISLFLPEFFLG
ncbi:MAG TPA: TRAP transporter large permease [Desulfobacteraceae bacterium]|mgnify:CR=1 FL=1|nr:TRAP transporter large permease [Desulfobacteraceae bacterium]|tara:strand:- start:182 stop:1474 length:1293 start_codon:yes stop_codon:yes gene_type:complete